MFSSNGQSVSQVLAQFNIDVSLTLPEQERHLVNDSRVLSAGDIFCAVNGTKEAGSAYIPQALAQNCHVVLLETEHGSAHGSHTVEYSADGSEVVIIRFFELNKQLFNLASEFYQRPQQQLTVVGVTGTNGKTSTCQMIAKLLSAQQKACAVIGTNGAGKLGNLLPIINTTPGATELMKWLQSFVEQGQQYVAMEVSSHALEQRRVSADLYNVAVFTNLTRDHLDYHQTMDNYAKAKRALFSGKQDQTAIINGDDATAQQWLAKWLSQAPLIVYGRDLSVTKFQHFAYASEICHTHQGVSFKLTTHLGNITIESCLIGDFNVDNLLAAIAVLLDADVALGDIATAVTTLTPTMGRMEAFSAAGKALAVVDYAHTPDALKNALLACRQHCQGQLWVVFGCGGDRDKGKRPLMGEIAQVYSDRMIVTNDNPRTEQPEQIAGDILAGCKAPDEITVVLEREQAVLSALKQAKQDDVVLLAGKGHEDYIVIGEQKISYNERELVRSTYAQGAQL
ncbi:UDP-N-acetylmuramoyl-L-alanyl-D-glutamate--2,6-diaminopimelate ligase [Thalassotalea sp. G2M2-11]|uniref:UDP-N-acetylmuramoyl-L-alanyl-D-glutamate--2, 6-diaminopimelate ligase n=1 Tax=Thalassotalea sp. G2M2-11 TaxID=2787627 RepID=UPI0019CF7B23|nr:UDP-N-acetylmuramoyl-L-alanyl-D-glutamate--2,6-diaminopimelate ligase [Thalassotalea sp. G2M2-11]